MDRKLLLVDDESAILRSLKRLFRRSGYQLLMAETAEEGLAICSQESPQVILSDFMLPGMNGSELLQKTSTLVPPPVGILLSGQAELNLVLDALNSGQVFKFITKPWDDQNLLDQVERAFKLFESQVLPPFVPGPGQCVLKLGADGALLQASTEADQMLHVQQHFIAGARLGELLPGMTPAKCDYLLHHPGSSITLGQEYGSGRFSLCSRVEAAGEHEVLLASLGGPAAEVAIEQKNRTLGQSQILERIRSHLEEHDTPCMVACMEVARFRELNRQLGFMASSSLLSLLGQCIHKHLPPEVSFGVLGAEQFALLIPATEAEGVKQLTRLLEHFSEPQALMGRSVMVPLYAGYSLAGPEHGANEAESLLQQAASAVHSQASAGVVSEPRRYDPLLDEDVANRDRIENALFGALERNEFSLVYQPKVQLETGTIVGAEALLRWKNNELGNISPAIFIPMAEENGLINIIGDWVLAAACSQIRVWRLQEVATVPISVNLAAPQLRNDSLVSKVTGIINESGSSPQDLKIELTETSLIQDIESSAERIEELRTLGVGIALDDFGTGYSSLSYLHRLPIDVLKIDKCFIDEISPDSGRGRLVKHIINMAHDMGYEVIAEGVESPYQLEVLREFGCDIVQGYVYSAPVAPNTLREMLVEQPFENQAFV